MIKVDKAKDWIRENIPMLMVLIENKYTGMAYDRFASLPGAQQRQIILGTSGVLTLMVLVHLLFSYNSLWSANAQVYQSLEMASRLRQYQKQQKEQGSDMRLLERNSALAAGGSLKAHLLAQARLAGISPRMIQAEESGADVDALGEDALNMKRATVKLQRVNLNQLKIFLQGVEFGSYSLEVPSIKVRNDDKIRGYMDVDIGIVAYLFGSGGAEQ